MECSGRALKRKLAAYKNCSVDPFLTIDEEWHRFALQLLEDHRLAKNGIAVVLDMTWHIGLCTCSGTDGYAFLRLERVPDEVRIRCWECAKYIPSRSERRRIADEPTKDPAMDRQQQPSGWAASIADEEASDPASYNSKCFKKAMIPM